MDALASSSPVGFQQLISHISLYHNPMSVGFDNFVRHTLRNDVKLRNSDSKYTLWNVPAMGTQLGKVMPFDIHGQHVLIDEKEVMTPSKKITHGVLRYAISAAGVRRREGGRWLYDYATMNFALACGTILGGAFLYHSRRRFTFLQRRPALSILCSLCICGSTIPVVRSLFKILAVGITIAKYQHAKALKVTPCYDCLCDIYEFTEDQIGDMKIAKLPPPKPGMPPVTPEQHKAFDTAMQMQALVLGEDLTTIRSILKKMLQGEGMLHQKHFEAEHMKQLRKKRKEKAIEEAESRKKEIESSSKSKNLLLLEKNNNESKAAEAAALEELDKFRGPTKKELEEELTRVHSAAEEAAMLINARRVPEKLLCEVHRGLRHDPDHYEHPDKFPIFAIDRALAKKRPPLLVKGLGDEIEEESS